MVVKNSLLEIPEDLKGLGASMADFGDPVGCRFPTWATKSKASLTADQILQVSNSWVQFTNAAHEYDEKSAGRVAARIERAIVKFGLESQVGTVSQPFGQQYAAFGGATTLRDALNWAEAQSSRDRVINTVYMMDAITSNILAASADSVPDQLNALQGVLSEIGSYLGELGTAPQSLEGTQMEQRSEATPTQPTETPPVVAPPQEHAPQPAPAPAVPAEVPATAALAPTAQFSEVVGPVVSAIGAFQTSIIPILDATGLSKEDRLKQIQPELERMSVALVEAATGPPNPQDALVSAMQTAIGAELSPLVQSMQMLLAKLGSDQAMPGVRQTFSHVAVQQGPTQPAKPNSIADIVKKTTFRPGQGPRNTQ